MRIMAEFEKKVRDILSANNCRFVRHGKGDHFIYYKAGVDEIINIQPDGNKAKPYQVKQVRNLLTKYKLEV